jgi:hypothetical protein
LIRELQREKIRNFERCDLLRPRWRIQSGIEWSSRAFDQSPFQEAREREVDLLADDRPQESVKHRRRARDSEFRPTRHQPRQSKFARESAESRGVLFESEPTDDNRVSLNREHR